MNEISKDEFGDSAIYWPWFFEPADNNISNISDVENGENISLGPVMDYWKHIQL